MVAILTGALVAALHAVLVIRFKVDQIVSGVAINIFGTGMTSFISSRYLESNIDLLNNSGTFKVWPIPVLSQIPILGPIFFEHTPIVYITFLLVILMHIVLFYTPWGLRTRAVGEHPKAADTLGINVFMTRYVNVIIGGMIAGIGGAYFTIGSVGRFDQNMTVGQGLHRPGSHDLRQVDSHRRLPLFAAVRLRRFAAGQDADPAGADPLGVPGHGALHRHDDRADRHCGAGNSAGGRRRGLRKAVALSALRTQSRIRPGASIKLRRAVSFPSRGSPNAIGRSCNSPERARCRRR